MFITDMVISIIVALFIYDLLRGVGRMLLNANDDLLKKLKQTENNKEKDNK